MKFHSILFSVLCILFLCLQAETIRKPKLEDAIKAHIYADNWFKLYINGKLVAVDSISFVPHNVISVDILPSYPMVIAVVAKDQADPKTGMEYANTNIGDGGFMLKFLDGTVTDESWKVKVIEHGPIDGNVEDPKVKRISYPEGWMNPNFDDQLWSAAKVYSNSQVKPKQTFYDFDFQGAKFIWSDDLKLDNTVLFRKKIQEPKDGKHRLDFSNLHNQIPQKKVKSKLPK